MTKYLDPPGFGKMLRLPNMKRIAIPKEHDDVEQPSVDKFIPQSLVGFIYEGFVWERKFGPIREVVDTENSELLKSHIEVLRESNSELRYDLQSIEHHLQDVSRELERTKKKSRQQIRAFLVTIGTLLIIYTGILWSLSLHGH